MAKKRHIPIQVCKKKELLILNFISSKSILQEGKGKLKHSQKQKTKKNPECICFLVSSKVLKSVIVSSTQRGHREP